MNDEDSSSWRGKNPLASSVPQAAIRCHHCRGSEQFIYCLIIIDEASRSAQAAARQQCQAGSGLRCGEGHAVVVIRGKKNAFGAKFRDTVVHATLRSLETETGFRGIYLSSTSLRTVCDMCTRPVTRVKNFDRHGSLATSSSTARGNDVCVCGHESMTHIHMHESS